MPKIIFIQPTQYESGGKGLCKQKKINLPGLVFPLLAAMTPKRWEIKVLIEVVDEINFDEPCDIVGIGTMGHAIFRGIEIADEFKKRGRTVVMGGYMASMVPQMLLERGIDSVLVGDAEKSWPALLDDFETTGKLKPIYDNPVDDLSGLPIPRYDLLTAKNIGPMLPVQAGRGCPHLCSFCSIACIYRGKYLTRPIDEVMRDIYRVKELGFKRFYLIDDNIVGQPGYLEELVSRIKPLGMKWSSQCSLNLARNERLLRLVAQSGCEILSFGIESITQEGLDKLNKKWVRVSEHEELLRRITAAGIMPSTEMMLGTDSDTVESIKATYDFVMRAKIPIPRFYILTPMPGSELYDEFKKSGRLLHEDYRRYDGTTCVHRPALIEPDVLTEMYWWINSKVFSMPSILKRTVLNPAIVQNAGSHLFALAVNLHYRRYIIKHVTPNIF
ncbi:B12-binding domain-containing radical SAM protein [Myxococcota bacterium]|nr:B12-binding domain-containing radical SAM protein [Myxococcota bacterium]MBU1382833.1 B12-binding domain-containing radical SAM protein [Myxococcota bacterium]MBU1498982.1 B12-binding domain-containing radical SAM protein [Myxococcota bacterium]